MFQATLQEATRWASLFEKKQVGVANTVAPVLIEEAEQLENLVAIQYPTGLIGLYK